MAFIQCHYFSSVLNMNSSLNVFLPQKVSGKIGLSDLDHAQKRYPTLYLLHGYSDDHTQWQRFTSLERYVADLPLAVIMPNGHRSFYTNMKNGFDYETALTTELIEICEGFFPLSPHRQDRFVAGLSMGGYGAFKFALKHPDLYSKAISFSGVLDIRSRYSDIMQEFQTSPDFRRAFGDQIEPSDDLFSLVAHLKQQGQVLPALQFVCGTEDFLYEDNQRFKEHLEKLAIAFDYREGPGIHDWVYWDREIEKSLSFLVSP